MVLEKTSLFVDIDHAVHQLAERLVQSYRDCLIVVMSKSVMPVAEQIARRLGINVISVSDKNNVEWTDPIAAVRYDYNIIHNSGRDLPQDFIYHQEQSLRANLRSIYADADKSMAIKFVGKVVILVDELESNGNEFLTTLKKNDTHLERIIFLDAMTPPDASNIRRPNMTFVLVHVGNQNSNNEKGQGFDIIIENLITEKD